ncbi:glucosaminidase domain-containing protein [Vibrio vulnificus]|uniref:glucosaminidase domain-containing protein n=1 Tax=Vibrio vulnificus TaxID=672 RepID=UPI000CD2FBAF|nr:glucosaminidase domain-containing protein [Vibrio vulnificus]AVW99125.1 glucosaminidase [Vibrio vulnificus Env1]EGQ7952913.1 glucosaminidase [Vibrio vulnificus]EGQ7991177.1 glucosaminidase [Vibrio vulnificus]EGR0100299.1 glucosaminidase [Vibrio vulnificus]EHU0329272.1 glucosaminidase domain-containing protein [Vibrio vulnificus]
MLNPSQSTFLKVTAVAAFVAFSAVGPYVFYRDHQLKEPVQAMESLPNFAAIQNVAEKKRAFFDYLRPMVALENQRVLEERSFLESLDMANLSKKQSARLDKLASRYDVTLSIEEASEDSINELLVRANVLPEALVMIQAANESAWGTSRFARQANNLFGQWCYTPGCGVVPLERDQGAFHEVAKFSSVQDSVHGYFMNVNRNRAYKELREIRATLDMQGRDLQSVSVATELTNGLLSYSERGQDYVDDLQAMIRHNAEFWTN